MVSVDHKTHAAAASIGGSPVGYAVQRPVVSTACPWEASAVAYWFPVVAAQVPAAAADFLQTRVRFPARMLRGRMRR
jgi:hypothetical protein